MTLEGKVAVVTGAARPESIGQGIALRLGMEGANVICCDLREADETVAAIKEAGGNAIGFQGDITKWENCKGVIDFAVEKYGRTGTSSWISTCVQYG